MAKAKANYQSPAQLKTMIRVARGEEPADLVFKNVAYMDVFTGTTRQGDVAVHQGTIAGVGDSYQGHQTVSAPQALLLPGFIDAHVHIESSLLTPARFQEAVLPCGTTTVIWDPHEIANVWGRAGIDWALAASAGLELDVYVMIPSCVPSTSPALGLETSGATLLAADLEAYRGQARVLGLAEMMNFPGLLHADPDVLAKLSAYAPLRRDGHCPGLSGHDLNAYGVAGIHSCHESTTLAEAREKLHKGIAVLIREGSCAKDAATLLPLLDAYTSACLGLCSDDRNPLDIATQGHISWILDMGLRLGVPLPALSRAASFAPARLYGLEDRGAIAPGYKADLVLVAPKADQDWKTGLQVHATYKSGVLVDALGLQRAGAAGASPPTRRNLHLPPPATDAFRVPAAKNGGARQKARVIGVLPHKIITEHLVLDIPVVGGDFQADPDADIAKIAVFERHHGSGGHAVALARGFGLRHGAIATSINHDCHNVIAVGGTDALLTAAVHELMAIDGGIVVVHADGRAASLRLPIAGLMTDQPPPVVAASLRTLKALARDAGCLLDEPFLQLSFLALPVIGALKITDQGLVDVAQFKIVSVAV